MAPDIRDELVDFVRYWSERSELCYEQLRRWIQLASRKFRDWRRRYGQANEHNRLVPRDHWLEAWERRAIVQFFHEYPLEGYRRLCFMMLDRPVEPSARCRTRCRTEIVFVFVMAPPALALPRPFA